MDETWARIEKLFEAAQAQAPEKRAEFLLQACPDDSAVRKEVASLLDRVSTADSFLDGSPLSSLVAKRAALAPGTRLGHYEIQAPIGAGGMGEVYRARDLQLGRNVALKVLPFLVADDPSRKRRFEQEARTVAALSHPNIVAVFDFGTDAGVTYIVSELVDGEPLRPAGWPLRKIMDVARQIAEGLAAAHAQHIVHRDLKPANVLLTRDGRVKILDFGISKVTHTRALDPASGTLTVHTAPGLVMGTPGYMSPEQLRGIPANPGSDIFSFGVILYELLTGKRAFTGKTSADLILSTLHQEPEELPETVPFAVRRIVAFCLEKDVARRFQSAQDLALALAVFDTVGSSSPDRQALPRPPRRPLFTIGLLAALAFAAVGFFAGRWLFRAPLPPLWSGTLLGGPELASAPRVSPDGHWIAYLTVVDNLLQLGLMKPETGNRILLTHGHEHGYLNAITWSPDGARIYFDRVNEAPEGVFSIPVPSGDEQKLLDNAMLPDALSDGSLLVARINGDRQIQLFRFWPETGRLQGFPITLTADASPPFRAFPDGKHAAVIGTLAGDKERRARLYVLDLATGQTRPLATPELDQRTPPIAVSRDSKFILWRRTTGNSFVIEAIPVNATSPPETLFNVTHMFVSIDVAPDGSVLLDQVDRPEELLRFSPTGGHVERVLQAPRGGGDVGFAILADGRVVLPHASDGKVRLMAAAPGKDPVPLINTDQETSAPVAAVGRDQIAFLLGTGPRRALAIASVINGQILRTIQFNQGAVSSLAASASGDTLFCSAGGKLWAIPFSGGEPRRIGVGDAIAMDPDDEHLLVEVTDFPKSRLFRMQRDGSGSQEISQTGVFRLANLISARAVSPDGRLLTPVASPESFFYRPGVLDTHTGRLTAIKIDDSSDYQVMDWTPDGKVVALTFGWQSAIWRFRQTPR